MNEAASKPAPVLVVLPSVFGESFFDPSGRELLELWRDNRAVLAVDRGLIVRYLRLLGRLGVSKRSLRWWGWWLTSPQKVRFLNGMIPENNLLDHAQELARRAVAEAIIYGARQSTPETSSPNGETPYLTPAGFLARLKRNSSPVDLR